MKTLKYPFKIIFFLFLIFLFLEFVLYFLFNNSKKFEFNNNKKAIVQLFNLKYSKENNSKISKIPHIHHPFVGWTHPPNTQIHTGKKFV